MANEVVDKIVVIILEGLTEKVNCNQSERFAYKISPQTWRRKINCKQIVFSFSAKDFSMSVDTREKNLKECLRRFSLRQKLAKKVLQLVLSQERNLSFCTNL